MSTTGHESEAINVGGLKASLQKLKTEYLTDVAHLGENDGSAVIADFDPQTDTVWKKAQTLSAAEKEQVQQNIGVREWLNTLTGEKYVSVAATDQTTTSNLKALIDTAAGSAGKEQADTIYRVGKWDGSAYNEEYYSDYAWDGSAYVQLNKKSIVGEVFDITEYKAGAKYADLTAALGNNGENVPQNVRKGGMSVKYVNTDNKYVQYRLLTKEFSIDVNNWYNDSEITKSINSALSNEIDERTLIGSNKIDFSQLTAYSNWIGITGDASGQNGSLHYEIPSNGKSKVIIWSNIEKPSVVVFASVINDSEHIWTVVGERIIIPKASCSILDIPQNAKYIIIGNRSNADMPEDTYTPMSVVLFSQKIGNVLQKNNTVSDYRNYVNSESVNISNLQPYFGWIGSNGSITITSSYSLHYCVPTEGKRCVEITPSENSSYIVFASAITEQGEWTKIGERITISGGNNKIIEIPSTATYIIVGNRPTDGSPVDNYTPISIVLFDSAKINGELNINQYNNRASAYTYISSAINDIPRYLRTSGLKITYLSPNGWISKQFTGADVENDWSNLDYWLTLPFDNAIKKGCKSAVDSANEETLYANVPIDFSQFTPIVGWIGNEGGVVFQTGSLHYVIPLNSQSKVSVTANHNNSSVTVFASAVDETGYWWNVGGRFVIPSGKTQTLDVPQGAKYLIVGARSSSSAESTYSVPAALSLFDYSVKDNISDLQLRLNGGIRICSYNIGRFSYGQSHDSSITQDNYIEQLDNYNSIIKKVGADIICLEEYNDIFCADYNGVVKYSKDVVFNKYPIRRVSEDIDSTSLYNVSMFSMAFLSNFTKVNYSGEHRYYLMADWICNGKTVKVIATHLAAAFDNDATALAELAQLITAMSQYEYVIICGDYNMIANKEHFSTLTTAGYRIANCGDFGDFETYIGSVGVDNRCIDNIAVKGFKIYNVKKVHTNNASDHAPLVCDLIMTNY